MIEGITILSSDLINKSTTVGDAALVGFVIFSIGILFTYVFYQIFEAESESFLMIGIIISFFISFHCARVYYAGTQFESYKEYKVTIDNNVKLINFNKTYEIISQEGQIYTIIEKDTNLIHKQN